MGLPCTHPLQFTFSGKASSGPVLGPKAGPEPPTNLKGTRAPKRMAWPLGVAEGWTHTLLSPFFPLQVGELARLQSDDASVGLEGRSSLLLLTMTPLPWEDRTQACGCRWSGDGTLKFSSLPPCVWRSFRKPRGQQAAGSARAWQCPWKQHVGATPLSSTPYSLGAEGPGWCHPGTRLRLTTWSQGQLPAGWGRSPGSLPLPWHTGARRLCCTSQENGPCRDRRRWT